MAIVGAGGTAHDNADTLAQDGGGKSADQGVRDVAGRSFKLRKLMILWGRLQSGWQRRPGDRRTEVRLATALYYSAK